MRAVESLAALWLYARAAAVAANTAALIDLQMPRVSLDEIVRSAKSRRGLSGPLQSPELHARVVNRLLP